MSRNLLKKISLTRQNVIMMLIGLSFALLGVVLVFKAGGYDRLVGKGSVIIKHSSGQSAEQSSAFAFDTDAQDIVPGDIFDRNGVKLCDFSGYPAVHKGIYIDNEIYSPLLNTMKNKKSLCEGLIGKYYDVLRDNSGDNLRGKDIFLTIDHKLQKKVFDIYKKERGTDKRGSAVVLDAENGEMLACVDFPTFNADEPDSQKQNLFYSGSDMIWPGSTFKLLTSVMILEEDGGENILFSDKAPFSIGGYNIGNWYTEDGGYDDNCRINYLVALGRSSNVFFANAMMQTKDARTKMTDIVHRMGIGKELDFDFGCMKSLWELNDMPESHSYEDKMYHTAATGFGQGYVKISAVHNAMIAAAIINGGKVTEPHMIKSIKDCRGKEENLDEISRFYGIKGLASEHGSYELTSPETAEKLYYAMLNNNSSPSYFFKNDERKYIGVKTGTAEVGDETEKLKKALWTVSNADINGHKYAVVLVQYPFEGKANSTDMKSTLNQIYNAVEDTVAVRTDENSRSDSPDLSKIAEGEIIEYGA